MIMKNFLLLFFTLFPLFVFSQEVEDKESKFPLFEFSKGDESEKNKSWGDYHFTNESYSKAIEKYEKINKMFLIPKNNSKASFRLFGASGPSASIPLFRHSRMVI